MVATGSRDTPAAFALMAAVAVAMLVANSPLGANYVELLLRPVMVGVAPLALTKTVLHWINDGLMAVFFLMVGIEIKRECVVGDLSSRSRAMLPAIAALGGMLVPALVYAWCNRAHPSLLAGWPVPTATDIAFALGVLALLARGAPPALRIFLLALAVIDDLGAIVLIAVLFTQQLSWLALLLAASCLIMLLILNRAGVTRLAPYLIVGFLLWLSVLKSGVHATLAGVTLGLAIPIPRDGSEGVAARLEHALHPWVTFLILPLFALANAGVPLANLSGAAFTHPVTVGITLGLVLGKFAGVFGFTWLAVRLGFGALAPGVTWRHLAGVAWLTGIGFTMSLFLGTLAFSADEMQGPVRLGVLLGSTVAALAGAFWLRAAGRAPGSAQGPIPPGTG
ncbi:MAG TPA: Na+/H+ antiporter NhaA [Steroidobacteraceae bacterium]|nr:Na+/H+ antiporter NhaA [Steroidobacteraceae bacterium]